MTLTEFQSYRPPNIAELRDPVLLTGPNGTVASGCFLSLAYEPPGAPGPLPILVWVRAWPGAVAFVAASRPVRGRQD